MSDPVLIDRLQFTLTVTFHYLFPILTMGLALFIAWLKTVSYFGRDGHRFPLLRKTEQERDDYESAARFWAKIFAVNFAVGVVTGIPLEFQFGTNWAKFSNYAGGVIGTDAGDGGRVRLLRGVGLPRASSSPGASASARGSTDVSAIFIFVGSWVSGFFIIATNAWMQHPVAYSTAGDKVELDSFWGLLTNPWVTWQYLHNMSGAAITGAFVLAAMGAFFLLSGKHERFARVSLKVGVVGALIFCVFQIFPTGDRAAKNTSVYQPSKFAAMEGLFETENGAPLVIIGNPDTDARTLDSHDRDAEAALVPDLAPVGLEDDRAQRHPRRPLARLGPARLLRVPHHGRARHDPAADRGARRLPLMARPAVHVQAHAVGAHAGLPVHLHRQHRRLDAGRSGPPALGGLGPAAHRGRGVAGPFRLVRHGPVHAARLRRPLPAGGDPVPDADRPHRRARTGARTA